MSVGTLSGTVRGDLQSPLSSLWGRVMWSECLGWVEECAVCCGLSSPAGQKREAGNQSSQESLGKSSEKGAQQKEAERCGWGESHGQTGALPGAGNKLRVRAVSPLG